MNQHQQLDPYVEANLVWSTTNSQSGTNNVQNRGKISQATTMYSVAAAAPPSHCFDFNKERYDYDPMDSVTTDFQYNQSQYVNENVTADFSNLDPCSTTEGLQQQYFNPYQASCSQSQQQPDVLVEASCSSNHRCNVWSTTNSQACINHVQNGGKFSHTTTCSVAAAPPTNCFDFDTKRYDYMDSVTTGFQFNRSQFLNENVTADFPNLDPCSTDIGPQKQYFSLSLASCSQSQQQPDVLIEASCSSNHKYNDWSLSNSQACTNHMQSGRNISYATTNNMETAPSFSTNGEPHQQYFNPYQESCLQSQQQPDVLPVLDEAPISSNYRYNASNQIDSVDWNKENHLQGVEGWNATPHTISHPQEQLHQTSCEVFNQQQLPCKRKVKQKPIKVGDNFLAVKPPVALVRLTYDAIQSSPLKKLTLKKIYQWLKTNYPYYRQNEEKWQNSLRHCLSFNDCFVKVPKNEKQTRKNCFWTVHPDAHDMFKNGTFLRRSKRFRCQQTDKQNQTKRLLHS